MALISRRAAGVLSVVAALMLVGVTAHSHHHVPVEYKAAASIADMSMAELEDKLQECPIVKDLNAYRNATHPPHSTTMSRIFSTLFPGSPAVNALLATLYISGPPNFLLALCPPSVDPNSLSVMVAFAVGGLLGDTLFHLLPEIFLGEGHGENARFVLVEPNRNLLLGVAILVGFVTFVAMDKGLRIATGGAGHSHDHGSHSRAYDHQNETPALDSATTTSSEKLGGTVQHRKDAKVVVEANKVISKGLATVTAQTKEINQSVKLAGYLNLIADFTHNITDGLAMASSFYASPTIGATTTVAVFFHEIPHEVGDFALLIQSGFSKRQAMGAQFVTALGALLGTCIGIAVQEFGGKSSDGDGAGGMYNGIWGTSLGWGDLLLPFTAGTFLFVGTVAVIPELLETGKNKAEETAKAFKMFVAMATGAGIMLYISWH